MSPLRLAVVLEDELALLVEAAVAALLDDDAARVDALVVVEDAEADVVHAAADARLVPGGLATVPGDGPLAVAEPRALLDRGDDLPPGRVLEDAHRHGVARPLLPREADRLAALQDPHAHGAEPVGQVALLAARGRRGRRGGLAALER